ncbi:hypothetical protein OH76DRAFT_900105 [Lentinus brumalis]|uniref:Uncharacterized protein n=1 Tax=Lentinus brumalis TaxID=2498619 RepID=A0A371D0S1_9APHY|nr:hypothetical protein OH76DRAFT_900105 [Polyporus brumalis]
MRAIRFCLLSKNKSLDFFARFHWLDEVCDVGKSTQSTSCASLIYLSSQRRVLCSPSRLMLHPIARLPEAAPPSPTSEQSPPVYGYLLDREQRHRQSRVAYRRHPEDTSPPGTPFSSALLHAMRVYSPPVASSHPLSRPAIFVQRRSPTSRGHPDREGDPLGRNWPGEPRYCSRLWVFFAMGEQVAQGPFD